MLGTHIVLVAMSLMHSSIRIAAPPEKVFDYVDDWRTAMNYLQRLVKWQPEDESKAHDVGAVYLVGLQAGPTRLNGKLLVTEYERPRRIGIKSLEGPRVVGGWTFTPDGEGTLVRLDADYDVPGGIAGRLVSTFIRRNGQRDLDKSVAELKRLVERS